MTDDMYSAITGAIPIVIGLGVAKIAMGQLGRMGKGVHRRIKRRKR